MHCCRKDTSFLQKLKIMSLSWWFILPVNFMDNCGLFLLFSVRDAWCVVAILVVYWFFVVVVHILLINKRKPLFLLVLFLVLLASIYGDAFNGALLD